MERPHDREYLEHLLRSVWRLTPVPSGKSNLRDFLSRAKAVVDGAATESLLPELRVNAAAEVRLEIGARLPGSLRDREVHRNGKGRRYTAQR